MDTDSTFWSTHDSSVKGENRHLITTQAIQHRLENQTHRPSLFFILYSGTESIRASVWNTAAAAAPAAATTTTTAGFLSSS
jgi:hypothetical protein